MKGIYDIAADDDKMMVGNYSVSEFVRIHGGDYPSLTNAPVEALIEAYNSARKTQAILLHYKGQSRVAVFPEGVIEKLREQR